MSAKRRRDQDRKAARGSGSTEPSQRRRRTGGELSRAGTGGSSGGPPPLLIWSGIAVVIAVVVIGAAVVLSQSGGPGSVQSPTVTTPANIAANGRTLGNANAPVTIDIYGDFRCSACYGFSVTSNTEGMLVSDYVATGKARIVWHDYLSIDQIQRNNASRDAANAAWCAADQGKFWPMHDWLYANDGQGSEDPSYFTRDRLLAIGQAVGLDMKTFTSCVTNGTHFDEISAEMRDETRINGTPTVLVNGQAIDPGYVPTFTDLAAAIDDALKLITPTPAATLAPSPTPAATAVPSPSAS